MAIKKSDLYSSLWASCDQLRGGMDASQYKDYVLFMLFIKYISDKYADSKEFAPPVVIPQGASFKDMVALKGKPDIGDKINTQIIQPLIDANARLARSDFPNFNDPEKLGTGAEMVERLTNLVSIFQKPELDFSANRAEHDDILGDAYEYLMRHFATESGKSKGQFYTPSEVSRIIAKVIHDAIAKKLNEKGKLSRNAIAEGIVNNVRKTIIRHQLTDPMFYAEMSKLLADLIQQKRDDTASYEEFLKKAEELAKKLGTGKGENDVPAVLHGNKEATVLYNNLPTILAAAVPPNTAAEPVVPYGDEALQLALQLDKAIREKAPAGWKGDSAREAQVLNAIHPIMKKNKAATLAIFEIIKNQPGY